jgi:predicted nucleic acid-binding protein
VIGRPRSPTNLVDASGWIEYFTGAPNAEIFAPAIEAPERLVVASLSILEVFKWILREKNDDAALQASALMQQGRVVDLDSMLALRAAKLGLEHRLPLADSIMYATAQAYGATLWTQDSDFEGLPGVRYVPKPRE